VSEQEPPIAEGRHYWTLVRYACLLGVFGGAFGLFFIWLLSLAQSWYAYSSPELMGGHWWWVALTAVAGLIVGLLRRLTRVPYKTPGLIADLQEQYVDPRLIPGILLVSTASLIGGASLGPEKALGTVGGGLGQWMSARRRLDDEGRGITTLSGMAGSFGGLFSSPMIVVMLIIEVARPGEARLTKVLVAAILSASISFGIYFAIAGTVFLDLYAVPAFRYEDWHLLAGVGIGLCAAVVSILLGVTVAGSVKLFDKLRLPDLVKSIIGGVLFGIIGVTLPLTMMTGTDQLGVVLKEGAALGLGLVITLAIAKIITMAVSLGSGFVGGPIFPAMFIGGSAGVALHLAVPSLPLGLTFTCMLAAVVGGFVSAPFAMVLFTAFTTQIGALNTTPVLIAVITSFLTVQAMKLQLKRRREAASDTGAADPAL
jgi:H+/Cl- antiporter ClcA